MLTDSDHIRINQQALEENEGFFILDDVRYREEDFKKMSGLLDLVPAKQETSHKDLRKELKTL